MSYLLDALKKSEASRTDALQKAAMQPLAPAMPRRSPYWRILLMLIAIGLLAVGWMLMRQLANTTPSSQSLAQKTKLPTQQAPAPVMPVARPIPPTNAAPHATTSADTTDTLRPSTEPHPATKIIPTANKGGSTSETTPPTRSELPVDVQQSLPDIHIEGHIYDPDPAARMVVINGRIRREGQSLGSGVNLEEITEHGIILNRQGMRFRISVFGQ